MPISLPSTLDTWTGTVTTAVAAGAPSATFTLEFSTDVTGDISRLPASGGTLYVVDSNSGVKIDRVYGWASKGASSLVDCVRDSGAAIPEGARLVSAFGEHEMSAIEDELNDLDTEDGALDARIVALEAIDHVQNTDTGTDSNAFQIGTGGQKLYNNSGDLEVRNSAGDTISTLSVADPTADAHAVTKSYMLQHAYYADIIVAASGGTHTELSAASAASVAGDRVIVMPGSYTLAGDVSPKSYQHWTFVGEVNIELDGNSFNVGKPGVGDPAWVSDASCTFANGSLDVIIGGSPDLSAFVAADCYLISANGCSEVSTIVDATDTVTVTRGHADVYATTDSAGLLSTPVISLRMDGCIKLSDVSGTNNIYFARMVGCDLSSFTISVETDIDFSIFLSCSTKFPKMVAQGVTFADSTYIAYIATCYYCTFYPTFVGNDVQKASASSYPLTFQASKPGYGNTVYCEVVSNDNNGSGGSCTGINAGNGRSTIFIGRSAANLTGSIASTTSCNTALLVTT